MRSVRREPVKSVPRACEPVRSEGVGGTHRSKNMVSADRELDTLSRVLQGFDASADGRVSVLQLILRYTQYTHLYINVV